MLLDSDVVCPLSRSNPMDDAGFFSFTSFAWMTPMMWSLFRNRLDKSSLSLSSHDGADTNVKRFERLWEEEVAKVGLEKASLGGVFLRFQRTRLLVAFLVSILFTLSVFIGPAVLVYEILNYAEAPGTSTLVHGVGLCVALFISEFSKAFFASLLWAVNLRTAIRVKSAFSIIAFQKIISLRSISNISVGEVQIPCCHVLFSFWGFSTVVHLSHRIHIADRNKHLPGKKKGRGVCMPYD
uniref:ABC transmembrane type-1 domain-containing protein n=1 Tax=Hucho hucho TaxID=62062 RepID=A0A4W5KED5_9TELE